MDASEQALLRQVVLRQEVLVDVVLQPPARAARGVAGGGRGPSGGEQRDQVPVQLPSSLVISTEFHSMFSTSLKSQ